MSESPPEDISLDYDVIVIGAGISGLTAARELRKKAPELRFETGIAARQDSQVDWWIGQVAGGYSCGARLSQTVSDSQKLSKKDRVGGRTLTVPMQTAHGKTEMFDLGGQWVGRTQHNILGLINELGLETYAQYEKGTKLAQIGRSGIRRYGSSLPIYSIGQFSFSEFFDCIRQIFGLERLAKKVNLLNVFSTPNAAALDNIPVAQFVRERGYTRASSDAVEIAIRAVYGVSANRINLLFHLAYSHSAGSNLNLLDAAGDGAQAMKVKGGTQQICLKMAEQLGWDSITLNSAVEVIEVHEDTARTTVHIYDTNDNGRRTRSRFECSRVILAIPPSQCSHIQFQPEVPNLKRRLFDCSQPGHLIKFIILYESPFWRDEGLSGEMLSTGRTGKKEELHPVCFTFDATTPDGTAALVGFIHEEFADLNKEERCNRVVNDLMRFFGDKAMNEFVDYQEKVWSLEPFNGGCPVDIIPTGCMDAWGCIKEPYHTVHFASTETSRVWIGYMDGAVESGLRAANEVLHCMDKHNKVSYSMLKDTFFDSPYTPAEPFTLCEEYDDSISPWLRRIFFFTILCGGVLVYSKKYSLSYTAKTVKPMENAVIRFFTGIKWPE